MTIERNEAVAIFVSLAVVAVAFIGTRYLSFAGDPTTQPEDVDVVTLTDTSNTAAAFNSLLDATSPNGEVTKLIIEDITAGDGREVTEGSVVTVHYIGTLQNGTQFDNSFSRGEPFTFQVGTGQVIEGWEKGVVGMREGGERILVIPASLAYGNREVGPIPANSTLLFVIEVLEVR